MKTEVGEDEEEIKEPDEDIKQSVSAEDQSKMYIICSSFIQMYRKSIALFLPSALAALASAFVKC